MKPAIDQLITFLHAQDLQETRLFYEGLLGLNLVRDQTTCLIFQITDTAFLGFCEHIEPTEPGRRVILTLVTDAVDEWYDDLKKHGAIKNNPPTANSEYQIYHFFLEDPNGYWIEIQRFEKPL